MKKEKPKPDYVGMGMAEERPSFESPPDWWDEEKQNHTEPEGKILSRKEFYIFHKPSGSPNHTPLSDKWESLKEQVEELLRNEPLGMDLRDMSNQLCGYNEAMKDLKQALKELKKELLSIPGNDGDKECAVVDKIFGPSLSDNKDINGRR